MTCEEICGLIACFAIMLFMVSTILRQNSLQEIVDIQFKLLKNKEEQLALTNKRIDVLQENVNKLLAFEDFKQNINLS